MALTKVDGSLISGVIPSSVLTNSGVIQLQANNTTLEFQQTIGVNYTIGSNTGALSVGPLVVSNNVVITVSDNARWIVL